MQLKFARGTNNCYDLGARKPMTLVVGECQCKGENFLLMCSSEGLNISFMYDIFVDGTFYTDKISSEPIKKLFLDFIQDPLFEIERKRFYAD